jgi:hypothetical protein
VCTLRSPTDGEANSGIVYDVEVGDALYGDEELAIDDGAEEDFDDEADTAAQVTSPFWRVHRYILLMRVLCRTSTLGLGLLNCHVCL